MKYTQYFLYTRKRPDRAVIKDEWIQLAIDKPARTEIQSDGRVRKWVNIDELGKYLRVVLLSDGQTVHNAFLDCGFKEEERDED